MVERVHSGPYWVREPADDDFDSLERIIKISLEPERRAKILFAFGSYAKMRTAKNEGIKASDLRKHLRELAVASAAAAKLLGAKDWFFEDLAAIDTPGEWPHERIDWEVYFALREELGVRDLRVHEKFGIDPKMREISSTPLAARLASVSVAASAAAERLNLNKGGRPSGGANHLVRTMIEQLKSAGASLSCRYDDATERYVGTFSVVADWLIQVGVREKHSTLCKYGATNLSLKRKKGSAA
ncbi:MAG: hypothetical protein ABW199_03095 [Caulobacterales bacterium]